MASEGPFFFFSYARYDERDGDVERFYHDLRDAVAGETGLPDLDVGFKDNEDIEIGERWAGALGRALCKCKAFVSVWSANYFHSEHCGREWAAFSSRSDEVQSLILPVLWDPTNPRWVPDCAGKVHFDHPELPDKYKRLGLHSLMQQSGLQEDYRTVVRLFATETVRLVTANPIPVRPTPFAYEKIRDAFRADTDVTYLNRLWGKHDPIPITSIAEEGGKTSSIKLSAVYTELNVDKPLKLMSMSTTARLAGLGGSPESGRLLGSEADAEYEKQLLLRVRAEAEESDDKEYTRQLTALEAAAAYPRLVLLGAPGSGKSSFAKHLALSLAGERLGKTEANLHKLNREPDASESARWPHGALFPIVVSLADFVNSKDVFPDRDTKGDAQQLEAYLESRIDPLAKQAIRGGTERTLLLLDGLDETPRAEESRERLKEVIASVAHQYPGCRILVTSRPYAYQRGDRWRLDDLGFGQVTLEPLDTEAIEHLVDRWFESPSHRLDRDTADDQKKRMKRDVENPHVKPLAERPLMLTMMADLYSQPSQQEDIGTPGILDRANLYEQSVQLLFDRWNSGEKKSLSDKLGMSVEQVHRALDQVAYEVHGRGAKAGARDAAAEQNREDAGESAVREEAAEIELADVLPALEQHRGDVESVDSGKITKYLAGASGILLREPDLQDELNQRLGIVTAESPDVFRFPHLSYQEYLAARHLNRYGFPESICERVREAPRLWREVFLFAAAAKQRHERWTLLEELVPRGPEADVAPDDRRFLFGLYAGLAVRESGLWKSPKERDKAKLERIRRWLEKTLEVGAPKIEDRVEAGRVLGEIGDERPEVGVRDGVPDIDWVPIRAGTFWMGEGKEKRKVDLLDYRISRYPVTNAQYRAFVKDEGYTAEQHRDCWTTEGLKWKEDKTGPDDDLEAVFLLDNHPRVSVCWYEAWAFSRWLGKRLKQEVRLPTEQEWEKAARGSEDAHVHPWKGEFDKDKCNSSETGIGTTTAVGLFPEGKSPYGLLDGSYCQELWISLT